MTQLLVLVDGSSYLYRAFHALPALTNSKGQPTGAMHGVIAMLKRLRGAQPTDHFAVVFDPRGPTHRDAWFPAYKANRPSMPDELASQVAPLIEIIKAMGMPLLQYPGVEADDLIASLTARAEAAGMRVLISTGDKDLAQLVNAQVTLINTMDDTVLDRAGVIAKFGVPPERIVDYLTLVGDSVDNVPGVPMVGPKTACKWINTYGDLAGVVAHAAEITGKVGDNLRNALVQLPLAQRLVTVMRDIDIDVVPDDLRLAPPDNERLLALFRSGFLMAEHPLGRITP